MKNCLDIGVHYKGGVSYGNYRSPEKQKAGIAYVYPVFHSDVGLRNFKAPVNKGIQQSQKMA
jgi:hypothetical protein